MCPQTFLYIEAPYESQMNKILRAREVSSSSIRAGDWELVAALGSISAQ